MSDKEKTNEDIIIDILEELYKLQMLMTVIDYAQTKAIQDWLLKTEDVKED